MSPDRRYLVFTDPKNHGCLRMMDFKEQMVRTILPNVTVKAMTIDSKGQVWIMPSDNHITIIDLVTFKPVSEITLKADDGIGFMNSIALDEKHNRLYGSGWQTKSGWFVWYFDLANEGAFHGVLKGERIGPNGGYAGPFDGYRGYGEFCTSVYFGPDDPDHRFLYMRVTDTSTFMRLDLEKRMVSACSGPPRNQTGPVKFIDSGAPNPTVSHMGPVWLPNGDFTLAGVLGRPTMLYRRVK